MPALLLLLLCPFTLGAEDETGGCVQESISHHVQAGAVVYDKGYCASRGTQHCRSQAQYTGSRNRSLTGANCQRWDKQEPHKHDDFKDVGEHNFCRITDGRAFPWCYTTDPKKEWEECFVDCNAACVDEAAQCSWRKSAKCNYTSSYGGRQDRTITGKLCQKWSSQSPHGHDTMSFQDNNLCLMVNHTAPWCYTTDSSVRWEECFAACNGTCVDEEKNCAHRMTKICMDKFESGWVVHIAVAPAEAWNVNEPHKPSDWGNNIGAHNFCRNQDSDSAPWCYTTDPAKEWEECYPACTLDQEYKDEGPNFNFKGVNHVILFGPRSTFDWETAQTECSKVYNGSLLHLNTAEEAKELATKLFAKLDAMPTSSVFVSRSSSSRGGLGVHKTLHAFWLRDRIACPGDSGSSELKKELLGKSGGPCLALDMSAFLNKPRVLGWRFRGCGPLKARYFSKAAQTVPNIRPINADNCIMVCADRGFDIAATTGIVTYNHTGTCLCANKKDANVAQDLDGDGVVSPSCDFQCQGNLLHSCGSRSSEEVVAVYMKIEAERTFTKPVLHPDNEDFLLDYCLAQGTDACAFDSDMDRDECGCGQKAADWFCKRMGFSRSDEMVGKYPPGDSKETLRLGKFQALGPTDKGLTFLAINCVLDDANTAKEESMEDFVADVAASQLVRPLDCAQLPFTICRLDDSAKNKKEAKKSRCPGGWCEHLGNCYAVTNTSASHWDYVRGECAATPGADLVSIHSQAESDFVSKIWMASVDNVNDFLLTGLHQLKSSALSTYTWSDGSPLEFRNWAAGEPNRGKDRGIFAGGESCVGLNSKGWSDIRCDQDMHGMCKLSLAFDKVTEIRNLQPRNESEFYCESGWHRYESICFKLHTHKRHYSPDMCASEGHKAALAYIADDLTNAFLRTLLAKDGVDEAWIGFVEQGRHRNYWQSEDIPYFSNLNASAYANIWSQGAADDSAEETSDAVRTAFITKFSRNISVCHSLSRASGLWFPRVFDDMCKSTQLAYLCSAHPTRYSEGEARKAQTPAYPKCSRPGYEEYLGNCYGLYNYSLNWWDAESHCKREGGSLITILKEDEFTFMLSSLFRIWIPKIWTGLRVNKLKYQNDTTKLKEILEWNDDGTRLTYAHDTLQKLSEDRITYWEMKKNVRNQVMCFSFVVAPSAHWKLEYCRDKRHFICQYPTSKDSATDPDPGPSPKLLPSSSSSPSKSTSTTSTSTSTTTTTTTAKTTTRKAPESKSTESTSSTSTQSSTTPSSTTAKPTTSWTDPYLEEKKRRERERYTTTTAAPRTAAPSAVEQSRERQRERSSKSARVAMIIGPIVALLVILMGLWYYGGRCVRTRIPNLGAKSELADPATPLSLNVLIQRMEQLDGKGDEDDPPPAATS